MSNQIRKAIELVDSGVKVPAVDLVSATPSIAAIISKLEQPAIPATYTADGIQTAPTPDQATMRQMSLDRARDINDSKSVLEILPDVEFNAQLLVSCIISPEDFITTKLTFTAPNSTLSPAVTAQLLDIVREHFNSDYKITPLVPKILRRVLFETGSYPVAVIPENSIDELINGGISQVTMESLKELMDDDKIKPIGLLGSAKANSKSVMESLGSYVFSGRGDSPARHNDAIELDTARLNAYIQEHRDDLSDVINELKFESNSYIEVTDNYNLLKMSEVARIVTESRVRDTLERSRNGSAAVMESNQGRKIHRLNDREMRGLIYRNRNYRQQPISRLKTQEQLQRRAVGDALIVPWPSFAFFPVHRPGAIGDIVGGFLLTDQDGNPLELDKELNIFNQLGQRMRTGGNYASSLNARASYSFGGNDCSENVHLLNMRKIYQDLIEQDITARLRNGVYSNGLALARNEDVYRVMMARTLSKKRTRMLFVPSELFTYFALDYTADGIGKSLLDQTRVLNSMRMAVRVANIMAMLKNAIGRVKIRCEFDEDDPDARKNIEIIQNEVMRTRTFAFPIGVTDPVDLVDNMQRAGIEWEFDGHGTLPDMKIEFEDKHSDVVTSDPELENELRKSFAMATGLSPEMVDNSMSPEFAANVLNNNLLLTKRVLQIQEEFEPQLSDHGRKVILHSGRRMAQIKQLILEQWDDLGFDPSSEFEIEGVESGSDDFKDRVSTQLAEDFVLRFDISLPKPTAVQLKGQKESLEIQSSIVESALDYWIDSSFLNADVVGSKLAGSVDSFKASVKAAYMRDYMARNGILPDIGQYMSFPDADQQGPVSEELASARTYQEGVAKAMIKFYAPSKEVANAVDTVATDRAIGGEDYSSSTSSAGDEFGSDFGDEFGGPDTEEQEGEQQTPEQTPPDQTEQTAEPEVADGNDFPFSQLGQS